MAQGPTAGGSDTEEVRTDVARLFLALWPDPKLARSLRALCGERIGAGGFQLVATERIHLTLHFLGNVQRHRIPELLQALDLPFDLFELGLSRCDEWRHGLLVVIPDTIPLPMVHLHADLGAALRGLGLQIDEREFRPHLTLARRHFQALPKTTTLPLRWWVDGYVLVESRTSPRSEYQVLHRYAI